MTQATHSSWTLVTRASPAPAFDCFQRAKTEGDSLVPSLIIYQWTAWAWGYEGKAWEILTSVVPAPPPVCSMPILVVTSPSYLCHWTTLRHPRSGLGRPTAGLQSIPPGFCFGSERPNLSCRRRGREGGREGGGGDRKRRKKGGKIMSSQLMPSRLHHPTHSGCLLNMMGRYSSTGSRFEKGLASISFCAPLWEIR